MSSFQIWVTCNVFLLDKRKRRWDGDVIVASIDTVFSFSLQTLGGTSLIVHSFRALTKEIDSQGTKKYFPHLPFLFEWNFTHLLTVIQLKAAGQISWERVGTHNKSTSNGHNTIKITEVLEKCWIPMKPKLLFVVTRLHLNPCNKQNTYKTKIHCF